MACCSSASVPKLLKVINHILKILSTLVHFEEAGVTTKPTDSECAREFPPQPQLVLQPSGKSIALVRGQRPGETLFEAKSDLLITQRSI